MFDKPANSHHILTTDPEDAYVSAVMDRIRTTNYSQAVRFIIGEQMRVNEFDATKSIQPTTQRTARSVRRPIRKTTKPALNSIPGLHKGATA